MPLYVVVQKSGLVSTVRHFTPESAEECIGRGDETLVPYDEKLHKNLSPGQEQAGKTFAPPPLSKEHRATAHLVIDEGIRSFRAACRAKALEEPDVFQALREAEEAIAIVVGNAPRLHDAVERAKTLDDLPSAIRSIVRGCPDSWKPHPTEIAKASAEKA